MRRARKQISGQSSPGAHSTTKNLENTLNGIQPKNVPAFAQLLERINGAGLGGIFSVSDWEEINANMRRSAPRWYRELLEAYPLGKVQFTVPEDAPDPEVTTPVWTCAILSPEALKFYSREDYFFDGDSFPQWFQFGEAFKFGGPDRWLISMDETVEPIVYRFSSGDTEPISTGRRFDDFLLTASVVDPNARSDSARPKRSPAQEAVLNKLESIVIPVVAFEETSVAAAVEKLNALAKEYDPEKQGIRIELDLSGPARAKGSAGAGNGTLYLTLKNESLGEALRVTACYSDLKIVVAPEKVLLVHMFRKTPFD